MSFLLLHQESTPDLTSALCNFLPQGSTTENLNALFICSEICFENTALSHTTYPRYVDVVYVNQLYFQCFLEETLANVLYCEHSTFCTCTLCVIWKAIPFRENSTYLSKTRPNVTFFFKISLTKTKPSFLWTCDWKQPNLLLPWPNHCVFLSCSLSRALGSGCCVKMEAKVCSWENWVKILGTTPSSLSQCSLSPWGQILFLIFLFYPLQCLIPRSALKYETKLTTKKTNNSWWLTVLSGQGLSPPELASLQIF